MADKKQNVFRGNMASATNPLAKALDVARRAEIEIGTGLYQSQVATEAETTKALFAQGKLEEVHSNAGAAYLQTLYNLEACRPQNDLGEGAQALANDLLDCLEELAGQHQIGLVEVAAHNIGRRVAQPCVSEKKGLLKRLLGG
jgi:hypothetical protein